MATSAPDLNPEVLDRQRKKVVQLLSVAMFLPFFLLAGLFYLFYFGLLDVPSAGIGLVISLALVIFFSIFGRWIWPTERLCPECGHDMRPSPGPQGSYSTFITAGEDPVQLTTCPYCKNRILTPGQKME